MRFLNFLYKINWALIVVHLVALFFLVLASQQFVMFVDFDLIKIVSTNGTRKAIEILEKQGNYQNRVTNFSLWSSASPYLAVFLGLLISLVITIKNRLFWFNSLIVFIMMYSCIRLKLFSSIAVMKAISFFSRMLLPFPFVYKVIISGSVFIFISLFLFFNKNIIRAVSNKQENSSTTELDL